MVGSGTAGMNQSSADRQVSKNSHRHGGHDISKQMPPQTLGAGTGTASWSMPGGANWKFSSHLMRLAIGADLYRYSGFPVGFIYCFGGSYPIPRQLPGTRSLIHDSRVSLLHDNRRHGRRHYQNEHHHPPHAHAVALASKMRSQYDDQPQITEQPHR